VFGPRIGAGQGIRKFGGIEGNEIPKKYKRIGLAINYQ
jgi:hypothetical protein